MLFIPQLVGTSLKQPNLVVEAFHEGKSDVYCGIVSLRAKPARDLRVKSTRH
jgi:hypothetical protein